MGRRLLALELGLVTSPVVPDEGSLSIDAGAGRASTVVVDAQSTLKAIRLVIAHAIASCLETNRQLQLPSLVIGERRFFLWSYLDLKSAEDLGLKWRPTQSLQGGGNSSVISVDEKTLRLATDDARRFLALEREVTRDLTGMEEASARASALARACAREMREARALVERSRRKLIAAGFVDEGELVPFDPDA